MTGQVLIPPRPAVPSLRVAQYPCGRIVDDVTAPCRGSGHDWAPIGSGLEKCRSCGLLDGVYVVASLAVARNLNG